MVMNQTFFEVLESRRSVKAYDSSFRLTREEIKQLLEATQKAPSSWNLQQWKLLVIDEPEQKERLLPITYGQKQTVESAVMIAILGDLEAYRNAEQVYQEAVLRGRVTPEIKDRLVGQIHGAYTNPQVARDEAFLNASLAAMQLMLSARAMGLDTCPMRGFNIPQFVEAFQIPQRYAPVMLIAVGKALKPGYPSFRFQVDDVTVWNAFV
jgi:nitroreductase